MITTLVSGKRYRVVGRASGHGTPIGGYMKCTSGGGPWTVNQPTFSLTGQDEATGATYTYYACDIAESYSNRKEHADEVLSEIKQKEKEIVKLQRLHEKLSKYESDEDEYAAMIIKAIKDSDSEKESIKNLSTMLKERFEYLEKKA